jgi:hypothetical protein
MTARGFGALVCVAFCAAFACSGADGAQLHTVIVPSDTDFGVVAETLDQHCGSLDCHGSAGRHLRLQGQFGRRLDPTDVPGGRETTPDEVTADYQSVCGLEPELLARVLAEGGAHPERLTIVRKAREMEKHTGGKVFPEGSQGDLCLLSFLAGAVDVASCNNSLGDP